MSDTVIKVENLSKSAPRGGCHRGAISHQSGERYTALRDVLANGAKSLGRRLRLRNHESRSRNDIWLTDNPIAGRSSLANPFDFLQVEQFVDNLIDRRTGNAGSIGNGLRRSFGETL